MKTLEIILVFIGILILVLVLGYIVISIQRLNMMQQTLLTQKPTRGNVLVTSGYYNYYNPLWNWGWWDNWGWGGRRYPNNNYNYNHNYNHNYQPNIKPTLPPTPVPTMSLAPLPSPIPSPSPSSLPSPSPIPSVQELPPVPSVQELPPPQPSPSQSVQSVSPMSDIVEDFTATTIPTIIKNIQSDVSSPQGFYRNALSTEDADMIQVYKSMNQGTKHQKEVLASAAIGYRIPDLERAAPLPTLPVNGPNTNIYPPWGLVN